MRDGYVGVAIEKRVGSGWKTIKVRRVSAKITGHLAVTRAVKEERDMGRDGWVITHIRSRGAIRPANRRAFETMAQALRAAKALEALGGWGSVTGPDDIKAWPKAKYSRLVKLLTVPE